MLKNKVTIISGSASGIGLEIAKEFLNQGAKVVFTDINKTNLDNVVRDFKDRGFDCIGIPADVSNEDDVINLSLIHI